MMRFSAKLGEATRRTEVVALSLILRGPGRRSRLHCHPADRIDGRRRPRHDRGRLYHGKGPTCGRSSGTHRRGLQRPLRIRLESFQAGQAAKKVVLASMFVTSGCPSRINRHSADWINRHHNTVKRETLDVRRGERDETRIRWLERISRKHLRECSRPFLACPACLARLVPYPSGVTFSCLRPRCSG